MLVDEQYIVFEACVEVSLETKLAYNGIMVAVNVRVDTVHALEYLSDHAGEGFREWDTNSAWEHRLVVYVALNPSHQMLDVCRCGHFGGPLILFSILPEILKSLIY